MEMQKRKQAIPERRQWLFEYSLPFTLNLFHESMVYKETSLGFENIQEQSRNTARLKS